MRIFQAFIDAGYISSGILGAGVKGVRPERSGDHKQDGPHSWGGGFGAQHRTHWASKADDLMNRRIFLPLSFKVLVA